MRSNHRALRTGRCRKCACLSTSEKIKQIAITNMYYVHLYNNHITADSTAGNPTVYHEKGLHNCFMQCHKKYSEDQGKHYQATESSWKNWREYQRTMGRLGVIPLNCTHQWEGSVEYWRIFNGFPAFWLDVFSIERLADTVAILIHINSVSYYGIPRRQIYITSHDVFRTIEIK